MAPQIDEPTYIYEQQTGTVVAGPPPSGAPANMTDHLKKENNSAERDHPVTGEQAGGQTVYVDHSNGEEAEALRYTTNVQVRYADETAYHISRYEYHQSQQQQHVSAHAQQHEDIKNEMERNHHEQAAIHNYESPAEGGHRPESQQVRAYSLLNLRSTLTAAHFFYVYMYRQQTLKRKVTTQTWSLQVRHRTTT